MEDKYRLLGLDPGRSEAKIKETYEKLQKMYDPDKFKDAGQKKYARERLEEFKKAYDEIMARMAQNSASASSSSGPYAYEYGKWAVISVVIEGDEVKVNVNGETKATGAMTIDPIDVVSEDATYTLGGGGLSMDFFRVNFKAVAEPAYTYTETEDVSDLPMDEPEELYYMYGDLNGDGEVDVFDLALMKRQVLDGAVSMIADLNNDHQNNVLDLVILTKYLHGGERGIIGEPIYVTAQ